MDGLLFDMFRGYVLPVLGTAISSLATWAMWQGIAWLKSKVHDARFHCAIEKLGRTTEDAVLEAQQTTVARLRKDDKWGAATAAGVRDDVFSVVKRHLGKKGLAELRGCLGSSDEVIDGRIRTMIESAVAKSKRPSGD